MNKTKKLNPLEALFSSNNYPQLQISARFPFFTEMLWYTLDRYIHCIMGNTHLDLPEEEKRRMRLEKGDNIDTSKEILKLVNPNIDTKQQIKKGYIHLTQAELLGIKFIVMYLHHLPHSKKNVPIMLPDPVSVSTVHSYKCVAD